MLHLSSSSASSSPLPSTAAVTSVISARTAIHDTHIADHRIAHILTPTPYRAHIDRPPRADPPIVPHRPLPVPQRSALGLPRSLGINVLRARAFLLGVFAFLDRPRVCASFALSSQLFFARRSTTITFAPSPSAFLSQPRLLAPALRSALIDISPLPLVD